jgi:hypothetical protein
LDWEGNWEKDADGRSIVHLSGTDFDGWEFIPLESVRLSAVLTPDSIGLDRLELQTGSSRAEAQGRWRPESGVEGSFQAALRGDLFERLPFDPLPSWLQDAGIRREGELAIQGSVSGQLDDPQIHATAEGRGIFYKSFFLTGLDARVDCQSGSCILSIPAATVCSIESASAPASVLGRFSGEAKVPMADPMELEFGLKLHPLNLRLFNAWVPSAVQLEGAAEGSVHGCFETESRRLHIDLLAPRIEIGGRSAEGLLLRGRLEDDSLDLARSASSVLGGSVELKAFWAGHAPPRVSLAAERILLASAPLVSGMASGVLSASGNATFSLPSIDSPISPEISKPWVESLEGSLQGEVESAEVRGIGLGTLALSANAESGTARFSVASDENLIGASGTIDLRSPKVAIQGSWLDLNLGPLLSDRVEGADLVQSASIDFFWLPVRFLARKCLVDRPG